MVRPSCAGKRLGLLALSATLAIALAAPAAGNAAAKRATVNFKTVVVGAAGNPSVGIVPFTDAIYQSCDGAPSGCITVGGVDYPYRIAQLEVTVKQWVKFLNTVDPDGNAKRGLYKQTESSAGWPKYGSINRSSSAPSGMHYSVAYPEWNDKPYSFADFVQSARFANALQNGRLLSKEKSSKNGFDYITYKVRLSRDSRTGMYDLDQPDATRSRASGFVVPSQNEWIKAAYYDPSGGGTYSYWKYPTNAGVFGDGTATAPSATKLNPGTGDVTNPQTQPLANYHPQGGAAPTWCPAEVQPRSDCSSANPFGIDPTTYAQLYAGNVEHRGPGPHHFAVGNAGPGRERGRVDGHDHRRAGGERRRPGLAPRARWHRERARLPAVALGGRPPAAAQSVLRDDLSVARFPDRHDWQAEGGRVTSQGMGVAR